MLNFLRRFIVSDIEPSPVEREEAAILQRDLNQARGEYRQAVLRMQVGTKNVMRTWENANQMLRDNGHD